MLMRRGHSGVRRRGLGVAAMRDVTARTIPWIPPTDRTGRGRPVDGIMPAGGLTETTRQTTSAEDPSSDAISFCLPIKWRLPVGTRYRYPKPTHQSGASGGCSCDSRPAEGWTAEAAIAFGEFVQPCTTTLSQTAYSRNQDPKEPAWFHGAVWFLRSISVPSDS